jgi:hypothetical protein
VSVAWLADLFSQNVVQSLPSVFRSGLLHHLVLDVGSPSHSVMVRRALLLRDSSLTLVNGPVRIAGFLPEGQMYRNCASFGRICVRRSRF